MFENIRKLFTTETSEGETPKSLLKAKYEVFVRLLRENNRTLEMMADLEEKATGQYLFDRAYVNETSSAIAKSVKNIIDSLNELSANKYQSLYFSYNKIKRDIDSVFIIANKVQDAEYVMPLEILNKAMLEVAGGKMANLGELHNILGLDVPAGFAISSTAFRHFMAHNRIDEEITKLLSGVGISDLSEMKKAAEAIRDIIINSEIPPDLRNEITRVVSDQFGGHLADVRFAVRSSAVSEDGEFSFAGQYATFLNVKATDLLQKYKEVVASLFDHRAVFYCKTKGYSEDEMIMAVGVLQMVPCRSGGVLYTKDPTDPDSEIMIVNATWGLPKSVVDGTAEPDSFIVSRSDGSVLDKKIAYKEVITVPYAEGIKTDRVYEEFINVSSLTDEEISELSRHSLKIETHYEKPQDIEWALSEERKFVFLQTRPLRVLKRKVQPSLPRRVQTHRIILDRGVIACRGVGCGRAYILRDDNKLENIPEGSVLIARNTSTKFVTVMNRVAAIVTDIGGVTGHMASLAREYGIPTILDVATATRDISDGQEITVDAINCTIYEGRVEELLKYVQIKDEAIMETPLYRIFRNVLNRIVKLNFVDPDSESFIPERCETFHDITRYAHEKAMSEMFGLSDTDQVSSDESVVLWAGIPIDAHLLDVGGGVRDSVKKANIEDIISLPFGAFLLGLRAMKWPEPRPPDVKGFIGMMAHTATVTEDQLRETALKSFSIISADYMNFSIRLGYHFSMVEAFAGENRNDNYITFFFKGGGAVLDRRLRRVRLITLVLKKLDFTVKTAEDVINASLLKYPLNETLKRLEILGRLTVFTKQLDMALFNDLIADSFAEQFIRDYITTEEKAIDR